MASVRSISYISKRFSSAAEVVIPPSSTHCQRVLAAGFHQDPVGVGVVGAAKRIALPPEASERSGFAAPLASWPCSASTLRVVVAAQLSTSIDTPITMIAVASTNFGKCLLRRVFLSFL